MSDNSQELWERMIREGQQRSLGELGHLSVTDLRRLGVAGKLPRAVVEFVIASKGREQE